MLKIKPECIPCTLSTGVRMAKIATNDEALQKEVVQAILREFSNIGWNEVPLDLSYIIQRVVREVTGISDPYKEIKRRSNRIMMENYHKIKRIVMKSPDPLETAVKLSIAGNMIDFGPYSNVDLMKPLERASEELAINDYSLFRDSVLSANTILYFLDNAGEIVLDKILIETMNMVRGKPFDEVCLIVKESPLVNDATLEDLEEVKVHDIPRVSVRLIGDGKGEAPCFKSDEVKSWIRKYDLTIFKGQANFEAFKDVPKAFFMLVAKCNVVAEALGVSVGSLVLKYSNHCMRI